MMGVTASVLLASVASVVVDAADATVCKQSDNNCVGVKLQGGCFEISGNLGQTAERRGLANPFCAKTNGVQPRRPLSACLMERKLRPVWTSIKRKKTSADRTNGKRNLYGAVVRLSFHDALESDRNTEDGFGTDGCLSANTHDHDGLWEQDEEIAALLEPEWQEVCDEVSRADFWNAMGVFALRDADTSGYFKRELKITTGRTDSCNCDSVPKSRFPDAGDESAQDMLDRVFQTQLGLRALDIPVLMGAHTIGSMNPAHSGAGFHGEDGTPWVTNPESFDNTYFVEMTQRPWQPLNMDGGMITGMWNDFDAQWENRAMLNVDMLIPFYLNYEAGTGHTPVSGEGSIEEVLWCGTREITGFFGCDRRMGCCEETRVEGRADLVEELRDWGSGNRAFLQKFTDAWTRMTQDTQRNKIETC